MTLRPANHRCGSANDKSRVRTRGRGSAQVTELLVVVSTTSSKRFYLPASAIRPLAKGRGACIASDRITVDGKPVGFMCRESPRDSIDSGWHFLSGEETQDYLDDPANLALYDVNTIANYDPSIIDYLDAPIGSAFGRGEDGKFGPEEMPVDPDA